MRGEIKKNNKIKQNKIMIKKKTKTKTTAKTNKQTKKPGKLLWQILLETK